MRDEVVAPRQVARALVTLVGALLAAAAWAGLVVLAVRWGRDADDATAWALTAAAGTVAVACMLVLFALLSRSWALWHGTAPPRRPPGRRRR